MTTSSGARVRRARRELAEVADELRALQALDEAALRARFEATFQLSAKGRSTARLLRRLAWQVQAEREGGLSPEARQRIAELAVETPRRAAKAPKAPAQAPPPPRIAAARDARLPPPGTVLRREVEGVVHQITVRRDDFEWQGRR
ncbi:MAG: DUF2924 domain-containing protein, partial [Myxococcales bacterium]|nr:DUF2924 domain-containing protein [Myxococcales bacterium]